MTGHGDERDTDAPEETTQTQDELAEAAEEGPLPGIADDADSDSEEQQPVGRRPHDEAKEAIGFMDRSS
jgi:hypothetical protein